MALGWWLLGLYLLGTFVALVRVGLSASSDDEPRDAAIAVIGAIAWPVVICLAAPLSMGLWLQQRRLIKRRNLGRD